jgi:spermidine synthase
VTIHRADRPSQEPFVAGANPIALQATLFVTGAAVMAIEILGARVIGPHFGASLYVWTALISVTLLALAGGYWLGGALADRRPEPRVLFALVVLSGALVLVTPVLRASVISGCLGAGLRLGAVLAATILFAPSLVALGCITPFATRLYTKELGVLGRSAGRLYAISTVGSFVGAVATGFSLVPNLATSRCLLLVGTVLVLTGLTLGGIRRGRMAVALLAAAIASIHAVPRASPASDVVLVEHRTSAYGDLRVIDYAGTRLLLADTILESQVDRETKASLVDYTYAMTSRVRLARPDAKHALLVGLGAGSMIRQLDDLRISTDVLEIDPVVVEMARRHFGWAPPTDGEVLVEDARIYFARSPRRYDAVLLDVYCGERVPDHLLTVEALSDVRDVVLQPGGIVVLNYVGYEDGALTPGALAVHRTLREVFKNVRVFPGWLDPKSKPTASVSSLIMVASTSSVEPKVSKVRMATAHAARSFEWGEALAVSDEGARPLTDDDRCLDVLDDSAKLLWRREALEAVPSQARELLLID